MTSTQFESRDKAMTVSIAPRPKQASRGASLAHQYCGNSKSGWLSHLPDSWLPYMQLACLSPRAGLLSIYFPYLFGSLHAAILQQIDISGLENVARVE